MRKIALYGGTFSPPHAGHAAIVEALIRLKKFDEVWVMPSGDRVDKVSGVREENRYDMVKLMIEDYFVDEEVPIKVERFEIEQPGLTETYITKRELMKLHPDCEFYFVLGSDIIDDIEVQWSNGKELFKSTKFVVIPHGKKLPQSSLPENVEVLHDFITTTLSSTFLRKLIKEGGSGMPYISPRVAKYIKDKKLYR